MASRICSILVLIVMTATLSGCGGYVLHGRVMEGQSSFITMADGAAPGGEQTGAAAGPTGSGIGIGGVEIAVHRDAGRLSQELIATGSTESDGSFTIAFPASAFGAGWMEEQWLIQASRHGYESTEGVVRLPMNSRAKPVFIQLRPGRSIPFEQHDQYMHDLEQFR